MAIQTPVKLIFGALPEGFTGTPDNFRQALQDRAQLYFPSNLTPVVVGGTEPTSNQGPWFKTNGEILFWDDDTGSYSISLLLATPTGCIQDFAGSVIPSGWLLCDGSVQLIAQYPALAAVLGTTYNTGGETVSQFRLPDCRGRASIGTGTGSGLTNRTLGQQVGEENHLLTTPETPAHTHTFSGITSSNGAHTHSVYKTNSGSGIAAYVVTGGVEGVSDVLGNNISTNSQGSHTHTFSGTTDSTGGGGTHNNMQPSIVFNKIIKW